MKILSALIVLVSCLLGPVSPGEAPRSIRVGTFKLVHMMQPVLYEKFLPGDVKVDVVYFTSSQDIERAVVSGAVDFGQMGVTAALIAGSQGHPETVVADAAHKGVAIVVKKESPIRTIGDLRGKKIATFPGSIQDVLLRAELENVGMNPDHDVQLIKVAFAEMPLALRRGDVDAFSGAEPHPTTAVQEGYGRVLSFPYDTPIGSLNSALVTSRTLARKSPGLVQQVVCAHQAATELLERDHDLWVETGRRLFGFDPRVTRAALANVGLGWDLSDVWLEHFRAMGHELAAMRLIAAEPAYRDIVDPSFSRNARAGACQR